MKPLTRVSLAILASLIVAEPLTPASAKESPARSWVSHGSERTEALYDKLREQRVGPLTFDSTPLAEVIDYVSAACGAEIEIDRRGLDDFDILPAEPISVRAAELPLGQALAAVLEPFELVCVVDGERLIVTNEEEAQDNLSIAVYPVGDLVLNGDYGALMDLVVNTIEADTWATNGGGEAEIVAYPQRQALVISHTSCVHARVLGLFEALRRFEVDPHAKPVGPRPAMRGGAGCGYSGESPTLAEEDSGPPPPAEQSRGDGEPSGPEHP